MLADLIQMPRKPRNKCNSQTQWMHLYAKEKFEKSDNCKTSAFSIFHAWSDKNLIQVFIVFGYDLILDLVSCISLDWFQGSQAANLTLIWATNPDIWLLLWLMQAFGSSFTDIIDYFRNWKREIVSDDVVFCSAATQCPSSCQRQQCQLDICYAPKSHHSHSHKKQATWKYKDTKQICGLTHQPNLSWWNKFNLNPEEIT